MFFITPGTAKAAIGVGEHMMSCPHCESDQYADTMVYSLYWNIAGIPMFPYGKEANVICSHCGYNRYGVVFGPKLISNFDEIKRQHRHPWFT
jgi:C4-type Zn-finger protein